MPPDELDACCSVLSVSNGWRRLFEHTTASPDARPFLTPAFQTAGAATAGLACAPLSADVSGSPKARPTARASASFRGGGGMSSLSALVRINSSARRDASIVRPEPPLASVTRRRSDRCVELSKSNRGGARRRQSNFQL
eukprot:scaffold13758_cov120-Isochrysis_galbana.AAC.2